MLRFQSEFGSTMQILYHAKELLDATAKESAELLP